MDDWFDLMAYDTQWERDEHIAGKQSNMGTFQYGGDEALRHWMSKAEDGAGSAMMR